jgi:hypothetical protein
MPDWAVVFPVMQIREFGLISRSMAVQMNVRFPSPPRLHVLNSYPAQTETYSGSTSAGSSVCINADCDTAPTPRQHYADSGSTPAQPKIAQTPSLLNSKPYPIYKCGSV